MPLSLDPPGTIHAALASIPAACLLALVLRGESLPTATVARTIVATALVSILMAALQVQSGEESRFYIHSATNRDLGVGFFANANHLASLLLIAVPLVAALVAGRAAPGLRDRMVAIAAILGFAALAGIGILFTASVAGVLLLVPTTIASLFLLLSIGPRLILASLLAAALAGLAFVGAWMAGALPFLSTRLGAGDLDRLEIARTTLSGIRHFWPVGSGLGAFPRVYPQLEDPAAVTETFVNHAHNDYLELLFETGLIGVLLLAGFFYWWTTSCVRAWVSKANEGAAQLWAKAATIVTGILLAHSLVDYPLRTPALLVCFLFFCLVLERLAPRRADAPAHAA